MAETIVWIEDDYDVIQPVVYPLEKAGYRIINYRSTQEALSSLDELRSATVILLDMFLPPGTDGLDFGNYPGLQLFKELRHVHQIITPVVVFTVLSQPALLEELKSLGAADIVRKPVRPSELKERVERVMLH
jgi:CheY-like chemotaxis protein